MYPALNKFCHSIAYSFNDQQLLEVALSHRSMAGVNNERLEFLGDSLVNMIIAEALYQRLPTVKEGQLTRVRAHLVKGETLAKMAAELNVGPNLRLGQSELKSGGFRRASILADALEAIIGAIYLDAGFETCQKVVLQWYDSRLIPDKLEELGKDAKTRLQEYLQSQKQGLPNYTVKEIKGEAHDQEFHIECVVNESEQKVLGIGSSRRRAEQAAARNYLKLLNVKT